MTSSVQATAYTGESFRKVSLESKRRFTDPAYQKRGVGRITFAVLVFLTGVIIVVYPYVAQYINNLSATKIVEAYHETVNTGVTGSEQEGSGGVVISAGIGEEVFGSIFIPKLELELPIYVGSTTTNLSKGIAHLEGTSLPVGGTSTHSVLAGHTGAVTNEWFTNIDKLEKGDPFYIRHESSVLTYEVVGMKVIESEDTSDLYIEEGRDLVTLLTCSDSGTKRLIVTGERL